MIRKILISTFALFLFSTPAFAKVDVKAALSLDQITLEDEVYISVEVKGGKGSEPVAPRVPGLDIVYTSMRSSGGFSFSFGGGNNNIQSNMKHIYVFTVIPTDKGKYTIPPFIVYSGGKEYKSNSLKLEVTSDNYSQPPPNFLKQQQQKQSQQKGQEKVQQQIEEQAQDQMAAAEAPLYWLSTAVTKVNPYELEQILFHIKLFSRVNANISKLDLPDFADFKAELLIPEKKGKERIGNNVYRTYEIVYVLTPLKTGLTQIGETGLKLMYREAKNSSDPFFGFGQRVTKNLKAPSIEVDVHKLPEPAPANFSGLVGDIQVQGAVSSYELNLGDSITWDIVLKGFGNIKETLLPEIQIPDVKVYVDKPYYESKATDQGVYAEKAFKLALVPLKPGEIVIPEQIFSVFDPVEEEYYELTLPGGSLQVAATTTDSQPSQAVFGNANTAEPEQAEVDYKNIMPLYEDESEALSSQGFSLPAMLFWLLVALGPLDLLMIVLTRVIKSLLAKRNKDQIDLKTEQSKLRKLLKSSADPLEVINQVAKIFGAKLKRDLGSKTPHELSDILMKQGISQALCDALRSGLESLEAQRYGGGGSVSAEDLSKTLEAICQKL